MSVVKSGRLHCSPFEIRLVLTSGSCVDSINKILCSAQLGNTFLTEIQGAKDHSFFLKIEFGHPHYTFKL